MTLSAEFTCLRPIQRGILSSGLFQEARVTRQLRAAVAIVGAALISSSVRAAIIDPGGVIHCSAQATVLVTVTNTPPDVTFAPPVTGATNSASASTSAFVNFQQQFCGASVSATVSGLSGIHVNVGSSLSSTGVGIPIASASGTVSFTEDDTEMVNATLTHTGPFSTELWSLKNSSNVTILSGAGSVTLTPGTYTLQWSSQSAGIGSPASSYALGVPEPAGLAGAVLTALSLTARRRRRAR
jgi:hypothetical protein